PAPPRGGRAPQARRRQARARERARGALAMPSPLKPISPERSARPAGRLDGFEDGGEALADADAEGGDPVPAAAAPQLAAEGAVVEAGGVAGGDGPALAEGGSELRQLLERGVGARALVGIDRDRLASLACLDRDDLLVELAGLARGDRALVAAQGESVLVLAA